MKGCRRRLVLAISLYICSFWPSAFKPILWISWRANQSLGLHARYLHSVHQLLTMAISVYFAFGNERNLGLVLNPSAWLSCLVRGSVLLAHDSLPLHGVAPTACSFVTIYVLVINFSFIIQHNHLMWLISWLTFSISNFSESVGGCCTSSCLPFPHLTNRE